MHDIPIPKDLLEIQTWFAKIITSPIKEMDPANIPIYQTNLIDEIRQRIAPSPHLRSEERIGIYQQQYWWRIITIMQEIYPTLVRLFDFGEFNDRFAEPYLLSYPPQDWFLSNIGSQLPAWLEKTYLEKDAVLVLELARLDLAYENLLFIDLLPKINPETLPHCARKKLYLQPFVMLFEYDADLFKFRFDLLEHPTAHWQTHDFPQIKKNTQKTCYVLYRQNEKNFYEEISSSRFELLKRFQKGAKLADLVPLMTDCGDIVEWFQTITARNWLSFSKI